MCYCSLLVPLLCNSIAVEMNKFYNYYFFITVNEDMLMALAHQNYKAGNYKQALEHSNAVYERNPQRTDNLLLLGAIHYQVQSKVPFIYLSELLPSSVPRLVELLFSFWVGFICIWSEICFIHLQLHDFDMCIAKNEEALQIDPHFAECYGNTANALKVPWAPMMIVTV